MQFQKGQSGNPAGRPRGARNRTTILMQNLLAGRAEAIGQKLIELAENGDIAAIRICMDRLAPTRRDGPVEVELPPIETPADSVAAAETIVAGVAAGDLTASEAADLAKVLDIYVRAVETKGFDQRLTELETSRRACRSMTTTPSEESGNVASDAQSPAPTGERSHAPAPDLSAVGRRTGYARRHCRQARSLDRRGTGKPERRIRSRPLEAQRRNVSVRLSPRQREGVSTCTCRKRLATRLACFPPIIYREPCNCRAQVLKRGRVPAAAQRLASAIATRRSCAPRSRSGGCRWCPALS